jgi:hypothetical protein
MGSRRLGVDFLNQTGAQDRIPSDTKPALVQQQAVLNRVLGRHFVTQVFEGSAVVFME